MLQRYPICNNRPETAATLLGIHAPLCSRCCGIVAGAFACAALAPLMPQTPVSLTLALLGIIICAIDGYRSYFTASGSTNWRRALTGAAAGWGAALPAS